MAKTAWPTGADVSEFATAMGVTLPSGLVMDDWAEAALAQWHTETGYSPFLSSASADYAFDPPGFAPLQLRGGFTAITVVKIAGVTQTAGENYWLEPTGGTPYTRIRFNSAVAGEPGDIVITGTRGYVDTNIPLDAWNAVAAKAAMMTAGFVSGTGASKIKQGSVTLEYGDGDMTPMRTLGSIWDSAVARYKRMWI